MYVTSTMYPHPEHFIIRPSADGGNAIVPLIAVDQLPDWVQLAGAPRELDPKQAVGLLNLGVTEMQDGGTYQVRLHLDKIRAIMNGEEDGEEEEKGQSTPTATASDRGRLRATGGEAPPHRQDNTKGEVTAGGDSLVEEAIPAADAPDEDLHSKSGQPGAVSHSSTKDLQHEGPIKPRNYEHEHQAQEPGKEELPRQAASPTLQNSRHATSNEATTLRTPKERALRPHMTEERRDRGDAGRAKAAATATAQQRAAVHRERFYFGSNPDTVYCRHWCHHGTCKWGCECRYQHRMPTSREGLREIGLRDFPTWYLLMAAGLPGAAGSDTEMGPSAFNVNAPNVRMSTADGLLAGHPQAADALLGTLHHASPRQTHQLAQLSSHHPSSIDLRLMQGRMSALLAGSTAMSNRQKLRQIQEMRELLMRTAKSNGNTDSAATLHSAPAVSSHHALSLCSSGDLHPPASLLHGVWDSAGGRYPAAQAGAGGGRQPHHGRASLHTNASLAANAASLARDAERAANAPVDIPPAPATETKGREMARAGSAGGFDELEGRLSPVGHDGGDREKASGVREGKLVEVE